MAVFFIFFWNHLHLPNSMASPLSPSMFEEDDGNTQNMFMDSQEVSQVAMSIPPSLPRPTQTQTQQEEEREPTPPPMHMDFEAFRELFRIIKEAHLCDEALLGPFRGKLMRWMRCRFRGSAWSAYYSPVIEELEEQELPGNWRQYLSAPFGSAGIPLDCDQYVSHFDSKMLLRVSAVGTLFSYKDQFEAWLDRYCIGSEWEFVDGDGNHMPQKFNNMHMDRLEVFGIQQWLEIVEESVRGSNASYNFLLDLRNECFYAYLSVCSEEPERWHKYEFSQQKPQYVVNALRTVLIQHFKMAMNHYTRLLQRHTFEHNNAEEKEKWGKKIKRALTESSKGVIFERGAERFMQMSAWCNVDLTDTFNVDQAVFPFTNLALRLKRIDTGAPPEIVFYQHDLFVTGSTGTRYDAPLSTDRNTFMDYLSTILPDEAERVWWLKVIGLAFYPNLVKRIMVDLHGEKGSGKSTLLRLTQLMFGGLGMRGTSNYLAEAGRAGAPNVDGVFLSSKRVAVWPEALPILNANRVKEHIGEPSMSCRLNHSNEIRELPCTTLLLIATNENTEFDTGADDSLEGKFFRINLKTHLVSSEGRAKRMRDDYVALLSQGEEAEERYVAQNVDFMCDVSLQKRLISGYILAVLEQLPARNPAEVLETVPQSIREASAEVFRTSTVGSLIERAITILTPNDPHFRCSYVTVDSLCTAIKLLSDFKEVPARERRQVETVHNLKNTLEQHPELKRRYKKKRSNRPTCRDCWPHTLDHRGPDVAHWLQGTKLVCM